MSDLDLDALEEASASLGTAFVYFPHLEEVHRINSEDSTTRLMDISDSLDHAQADQLVVLLSSAPQLISMARELKAMRPALAESASGCVRYRERIVALEAALGPAADAIDSLVEEVHAAYGESDDHNGLADRLRSLLLTKGEGDGC